MKQVEEILDAFVESYSNILKTNLIGIYLHGSLAMGCFNPESSDIDILVVVEKDISFAEKRELINAILKLSDKGMEIVLWMILKRIKKNKSELLRLFHITQCGEKNISRNLREYAVY